MTTVKTARFQSNETFYILNTNGKYIMEYFFQQFTLKSPPFLFKHPIPRFSRILAPCYFNRQSVNYLIVISPPSLSQIFDVSTDEQIVINLHIVSYTVILVFLVILVINSNYF